jgi:hypothetical protein
MRGEHNAARNIAPAERAEIEYPAPEEQASPQEIAVIGGDAFISALQRGDIKDFRRLLESQGPLTEAFIADHGFQAAAEFCAARLIDSLRIDDYAWMAENGLIAGDVDDHPLIVEEMKKLAYTDPARAVKMYGNLLPPSILGSTAFKLAAEHHRVGENRLLQGEELELPKISREEMAQEQEKLTGDARYKKAMKRLDGSSERHRPDDFEKILYGQS